MPGAAILVALWRCRRARASVHLNAIEWVTHLAGHASHLPFPLSFLSFALLQSFSASQDALEEALACVLRDGLFERLADTSLVLCSHASVDQSAAVFVDTLVDTFVDVFVDTFPKTKAAHASNGTYWESPLARLRSPH